MPTVQVNGQTMYFEVYGGPNAPLGDVLLMHGWVQIGREMLDLATALMNAGSRVILPDMPGYGQSVPPFRTYPPDMYPRDAALMAGFLDALGLKRVHIAGFSDGGETALLLGIDRPDLCRTVTAWGAIGAFGPEACERSRRGLPPTWITDALRAQHPGQNIDQWPYQWVEAFCAMIAAGGDISLGRAHLMEPPLLIMLGENDTLNPVSTAQQFIQAATRHGVPRLLHTFPNIGHAIHEAVPDQFLRTVLDFWHLASLNE